MARKKTLKTNGGNTYHDLPTYIKHWEVPMKDGWEIRILSETGLMTIRCRWKDYKRPRELSMEQFIKLAKKP